MLSISFEISSNFFHCCILKDIKSLNFKKKFGEFSFLPCRFYSTKEISSFPKNWERNEIIIKCKLIYVMTLQPKTIAAFRNSI